MEEERSSVGKSSKVVSRGRVFGDAIFQCVLDGEAEFGTDGKQNTQMIFSESILLSSIESEHRDNSRNALERHGQRGTQRAVLGRIIQVSGLDRRIAIQDGLAVLRYPSGQAFAKRNSQRRKEAEVVAA